jgi:hypothetical protein
LLRILACPKQNLSSSNISGHFLSMNNQFPAHSILVKFFHNVAKNKFEVAFEKAIVKFPITRSIFDRLMKKH